jgi:glycosyltransferase involved in cell wall biosynthesis
MRLAVVTSHPIQYQAPLFRSLAGALDLDVYFAHRATGADQAAAGFGVRFDWDVDLLSGYNHYFLHNVSRSPGTSYFRGCDTPEISPRLRQGRYDAVLVMGWYLKSFWQAVAAARSRGMPALVRGDSQLLTPRSKVTAAAKRFAYPLALRAFQAGLYVGQRSREYFEHYRFPTDRLFFSPHCVDTKWFAERASPAAGRELRNRLGIGADEIVLLLAGKLIELKRPFDLIDAAARLRRSGKAVSVLIAGSGPLLDEVRCAASLADVPAYPIGFQNQSQMPAVYAAADVLVLSSSSETWGLVANEALACGKPIVVADTVGCAVDLAADGAVGRTFPVGDCEALANAIADLLEHWPRPESIAGKSERYSVQAACAGILDAVGRCSG